MRESVKYNGKLYSIKSHKGGYALEENGEMIAWSRDLETVKDVAETTLRLAGATICKVLAIERE